jgi:hypothetical protein
MIVWLLPLGISDHWWRIAAMSEYVESVCKLIDLITTAEVPIMWTETGFDAKRIEEI